MRRLDPEVDPLSHYTLVGGITVLWTFGVVVIALIFIIAGDVSVSSFEHCSA